MQTVIPAMSGVRMRSEEETMKRYLFSILLMVLLLSGCQSPTSSPVESVPQGAAMSPLLQGNGASPLQSPLLQVPENASAAAETLQPLVESELGLAPETLTLLTAEPVEWPDASLGCPQPGMLYAQVITPGWRVTFQDAGGRVYAVHTARNVQDFVVCESDVAGAPVADGGGGAPTSSAVAAAQQRVAARAGVDASAVQVRSTEWVEWPDSCLGCSDPQTMCLMVITPGYRILLEAGGQVYEVHTDMTGRAAVLCESVSSLPGGGAPPEALQRFRATLAYLTTAYPGYALPADAAAWQGEVPPLRESAGAVEYDFRSAAWTLTLDCPASGAGVCNASLAHEVMGRVWLGTVSSAGEILATPPLRFTHTAADTCDASVQPSALNDWAGVTVTPTVGGAQFVQRISYVCCAQVEASLGWDMESRTLRIVEYNAGEICRCMCGYTMTGEIAGLDPGAYTLEIWGVQKPEVGQEVQLLERVAVTVAERAP